jgi:pyrroline-5-carboxylate reductase
MADALLNGFLEKRAFLKDNIVVSDIDQSRLSYMNDKFGVKVTLSNTSLLDELKIIILSVKPNVMDEVLKEIAPEVTDEHLMISVAAGYPISKMENFLGTDKRIVRVMPNTPSKIGAGASGFCLG